MEKNVSLDNRPAIAVHPYLMSNEMQHYAWGSRGARALIPRLLNITEPGDSPFAEYWMGAHPKAPSRIMIDGNPVSLFDLVREHPLEILGPELNKRDNPQFPFLLKILSAAEPLSIQVHPSPAQAAELHRSDSAHYPDTNAKPEIAIALDSLTALVGFQPVSELIQTFRLYPELAEFIGPAQVRKLTQSGNETSSLQAAALAELYRSVVNRIRTEPAAYANLLQQLRRRIGNMPQPSEIARLFLQLSHKYADNDIGLLTIFLLNQVELSAGQAIYMPPGMLHAYLRGNIIECMANSDNVIRAGLTPKFVDIENLLKVTNFQPGPAEILTPIGQDRAWQYVSPAAEFEISRYRLQDCQRKAITAQNRPEILFVVDGQGSIIWNHRWESGIMPLQQGDAIFIPAALVKYELVSEQEITLFRAAAPAHRFR